MSYKSAYRRGHSTETTGALEDGSITALIMLDLSAAFE